MVSSLSREYRISFPSVFVMGKNSCGAKVNQNKFLQFLSITELTFFSSQLFFSQRALYYYKKNVFFKSMPLQNLVGKLLLRKLQAGSLVA